MSPTRPTTMRTAETRRDRITGILPDSLAGLTKMLSGLRQREVIFVGLAATLPSRILIKYLPKDKRPNSHDIDFDNGWKSLPLEKRQIEDVIKRWRFQKREVPVGQNSQEEASVNKLKADKGVKGLKDSAGKRASD